MNFTAPASSVAGPRPADIAGHLLIISPVEYREKIDTVNGPADAIAVDLVDLDLGTEHENVLFFNIALRGALKPRMGEHVLARIGQGTAKPGKNAPWILEDATGNEVDVARARAFLAAKAQAPVAAAPAAAVQGQATTPAAFIPAVLPTAVVAPIMAQGPTLQLNPDGSLPAEVVALMAQLNGGAAPAVVAPQG